MTHPDFLAGAFFALIQQIHICMNHICMFHICTIHIPTFHICTLFICAAIFDTLNVELESNNKTNGDS